MEKSDLENRFAYHAPTGGKADKHEEIRHGCLVIAGLINALGPDSREKSSAITSLEVTMMWANAMVARHPEQ